MPPLDPDAVIGCLLGQAVGDMMGLPAENLSPKRIAKLFPTFDRPRFLFGYGMGSDDTEHACMTAQALLRSGGDRHRFRRSLAWRLRWWFLACPAGIGLATLKACVRLWLGWPSDKSGVKSAGNGPAMRAAMIGVSFLEPNPPWFVQDSTRITHTDRMTTTGTDLIAYVAWLAKQRDTGVDWSRWLRSVAEETARDSASAPLAQTLMQAVNALDSGLHVTEFAAELELARGVTGYIAHTIPVAVYAFLRHPDDYRAAVESVIRLGGDTDTVAAITGALVGARVGKAGIPKEWLDRWADWPRSVAWMEKLALKLAEGKWRESPQPAVPLAWWAIPFRNLFFFLVVLAHVFRRALPPY